MHLQGPNYAKNAFAAGLCPGPCCGSAVACSAPPDPVAGFGGPFGGRERKGTKGECREEEGSSGGERGR